MDDTLIRRFQQAILGFRGDFADQSLLLASAGSLSVHYAPFDVVNPRARVVIVGITPGRAQAVTAIHEAKRQLASGASLEVARAIAKETGAFSGPMRSNLADLLDRVGLARWLGLGSCRDLFGSDKHLMQSASVLPFPTFIGSENYNGKPDIVRTPMLHEVMMMHFLPMARGAADPVIIPLGPVPSAAIDWLVEHGHLRAQRVLRGIPHPSGANAERIKYFLGQKPRQNLSPKTDAARLDRALDEAMRTVAAL